MEYAKGTKFYRITSDLRMEVFELTFIERGVYNFIDAKGKPLAFSQGVVNTMITSKRMAYSELEEIIVERYKDCSAVLRSMQNNFLPGEPYLEKVQLFKRGVGITVHRYDKDTGDYIDSFNSVREGAIKVSRNGKVHGGLVSACCKGDRITACGFRWSYNKVENIISNL